MTNTLNFMAAEIGLEQEKIIIRQAVILTRRGKNCSVWASTRKKYLSTSTKYSPNKVLKYKN